jgi:hypothetical protein
MPSYLGLFPFTPIEVGQANPTRPLIQPVVSSQGSARGLRDSPTVGQFL